MKTSNIILLTAGIVFLSLLTGCPTEPELSSDKEITAFSFGAEDNAALTEIVTGTIEGTEISATVPYGTDVTAMVAAYTATGVLVSVDGTEQESGTTANDFTDPVTYTVTAEDGTNRDYTVTLSAALNDSKAITAYSFTAVNPGLDSTVTGTITGTDISVTVPYGTDISSLIADFTTTGESVTANGNPQFSGNTPNDFTSPVTYIVTAEDGSTRDYTVTVLQRAIEGSGFNEASEPGDSGLVRFGKTLTMIYVQNQASIDFPTDTDDSPSVELTTRFWMGETEVTNAVMAVVLQWAYDEGLFSDTVSDSNGIGINTVKYGGQELLDLDDSDCRVDYDGFGIFSAESSFEEHPVTDITWFGAVMFCNWLTEMRDGNADNVVYIWTDNGDGDGTASDGIWQDDETDIDTTKNGYRLPSSDEWEYTARYRGSDSTNTVSGYSNPYFTKGDSASGAYTYYNDEADVNPANGVVDGKDANDQVAVYGYYWDGSNWVDTGTTDEAEVKSLGPSSANTLGLYDMSGNVWEWCYTEYNSFRILRGGSWGNYTSSLEIGYWNFGSSVYSDHLLGFRLCRTAD